ncbi:MAG TPA: PriCT-2 domain-containing protein, partial [Elusimicrobiota bacterium]|nr:PriCT-2 domain-containing protein [Elusimicrobiota bacterium]
MLARELVAPEAQLFAPAREFTPEDAAAQAAAAADETVQQRCHAGAMALAAFLREVADAATPKGDERTNVIDQGARKTYSLDPERLQRLFALLDDCRREGTTTHFAERQGTAAAPCSGLMLDFDIFTRTRRPVWADRSYVRLAGALAAAFQRDLALGADDERFHVFFLQKPEGRPAPPGAAARVSAAGAEAKGAGAEAKGAAESSAPLYRYGFHVLVPGFRLERAYKRWLVAQLARAPAVHAVLKDLGAEGDLDACLDAGSASAPPLLLGSCKRGGSPYALGAAYEVTLDLALGAGAAATVRRLAPAEFEDRNLVAELSVVAEAAGARPALVAKRDRRLAPGAEAAARDWGARAQGGLLGAEELFQAESDLSALTLHDADARHVHAMLGLLAPEYSSDRTLWRNVVYALAHAGERFKPLAVWFSQRCPEKWAAGGAAALEQLWGEACGRPAPGRAALTLRSIAHWARQCDPDGYARATERSHFALLTAYVYQHGGRMQHYMVAKLLHAMLSSKFVVDIDTGPRGGVAYCWYEFVMPGQQMRPGEVWKWRREPEPDSIQVYISERVSQVYEQVGEHLREKLAAAAEPAKAKYFRELLKAFAASKAALYCDRFKGGVIRQAHYIFRRRGFAEQLDRDPELLGVANGVLRLGARCELVDRFHEHAVSLYTPVVWRPFDPGAAWTALALRAVADIIPEADARDWILFHAAQGLSCAPKEGLILFWEGGGQNGKTACLRWFAKALGPFADKFNIQLLSCDREAADRPNSAVMRFRALNYAYAEESNKAQILNAARLKELVNAGEISGRDLNERQQTFTMKCNLVAASQYSFIINTTDHGTWRRIRHYTAKTNFRRDPDPSNPLEKLDDQRFVRTYPTDPNFLSAVLSILCRYYERLQAEFGGELKNVPAPTIERETEVFRAGQDAVHRWIGETIVVSPESTAVYPLADLAGRYATWYTVHIDRRTTHVAGDVIKQLESSAIGGFLRLLPNRTLALRGCRLLAADETDLQPGERLLVPERRRPAPTAPAAERGEAWWAADASRAPGLARARRPERKQITAEEAEALAEDRRLLAARPRGERKDDTDPALDALLDGL